MAFRTPKLKVILNVKNIRYKILRYPKTKEKTIFGSILITLAVKFLLKPF